MPTALRGHALSDMPTQSCEIVRQFREEKRPKNDYRVPLLIRFGQQCSSRTPEKTLLIRNGIRSGTRKKSKKLSNAAEFRQRFAVLRYRMTAENNVFLLSSRPDTDLVRRRRRCA